MSRRPLAPPCHHGFANNGGQQAYHACGCPCSFCRPLMTGAERAALNAVLDPMADAICLAVLADMAREITGVEAPTGDGSQGQSSPGASTYGVPGEAVPGPPWAPEERHVYVAVPGPPDMEVR